MNRRLTDSSDNKPSFNRLSVPTNQWQTSSAPLNQSTATADNSLRAVAPNQFSTLAPNFGNQRFFTPRSSYFGQQNDTFGFSGSAALNMNNNYGSNYGQNYEYSGQQSRVHPYDISDSNRPIFSTDLSNINVNIDDMKKALLNANQLLEMSDNKPDSPESTSSSTDSMPKTINELVAQMKNLRKEETKIKNTRRDIDRKLEQLEDELKEYQQKLTLKENLKKIKINLGKDEEVIGNKIQQILTDMDVITKTSNQLFPIEVINEMKKRSAENSDTNVDKSLKKEVRLSSEDSLPKPVLKRPNTSATNTNTSATKKVKINPEVVDSSGGSSQVSFKSSQINTTPKMHTRPVMRKSPHPSKFVKSPATPEVDSPKINRICRQPTPRPLPKTCSSGVKSSRPQRVDAPLLPALMLPPVKHKVVKTLTATATATKTTANTEKKSISSPEPDSDDAVFTELDKISSKIDDSIKQSNKISDIQKDMTPETPVSNVSQIKKVRVEEQTEIPDDRSIDDNVDDEDNQSEQPLNSDKTAKKVIDVLDILSDDEEPAEPLKETPKEKVDSVDDQTIDENPMKIIKEEANNSLSVGSQKAMTIISRSSSICSSSSEEQFSGKESPFKVPSETSSVKQPVYKFTGFEPKYYEPTVPYGLQSFKAVAGPKSKTANASIISLKQFQNYIFASFLDISVRRFRIDDKSDIFKFEGHEGLVMALIIIECPINPDTYVLYTGGKDKTVRAFNAITGQILNSVVLNDEIICMTFNWSHIFCGLNDGTICKISTIHENNDPNIDYSDKMNYFIVNAKKRILSLISVKTVEPKDNDFEAIIAVSPNKLRVINTKDSVDNSQRVLRSINVQFCAPIYCQTYKNVLFLSIKVAPVKNEDKSKARDRSIIYMLDLQNNWFPINTMNIDGLITSLDLCKNELIVSCFSGEIQCIDCDNLQLKWLTYATRVTASVMVGDRLVLGNDQGMIDVIYVDQKFMDCQTCGVPFARHIDFKKHIQTAHKVSVPESSDGDSEESSDSKKIVQ